MIRIFIAVVFQVISLQIALSQEEQELKAQKDALEQKAAPVKEQLNQINSEIAEINKKINALPGWYTGAFGTLGASTTGRNGWYAAGDLKDASATTIMGSLNAYANRKHDRYFWRNSGSINLGWQQLKLTDDSDAKFEPIADILTISSLFGANLRKNLAFSMLADYRTSVIVNFNNPGYLDLGAGITYHPLKDMVFVLHPLNYNFIFAKDNLDFTSSLGCKIVGDFSQALIKGLHWRSNLTGFISYRQNDPTLHNGTWTNWLSVAMYKGLGIGIEFALRYSAQEVEKIQNYYTFGVTYKI